MVADKAVSTGVAEVVVVVVVVVAFTTCKTDPVGNAVLGKLVALVNTKAEGVPNAGVTNVGLVANTTAPEPVLDAKDVEFTVP
jgi:hypothetical protein